MAKAKARSQSEEKRTPRSRRQRWSPYARKVADILHLKDWRIVVLEQPSVNGSLLASCQSRSTGRNTPTSALAEGFLNDDAEEQRHTVTHELLHCHLEPDVAECSKLARSDECSARMAMEYCVDGLADALAIAGYCQCPRRRPALNTDQGQLQPRYRNRPFDCPIDSATRFFYRAAKCALRGS